MKDVIARLSLAAETGCPPELIDEAIACLTDQAVEIERLRADRDSWEQQASDRVSDAVQFCEERDQAITPAKDLIAAWESLPEGLNSVEETGKWLHGPMLDAIRDLRAAVEDAPQQSLEIADAGRVIAWARDPKRKPSSMAFTSGAERQAAYWIEWAEGECAEDVRKDADRYRQARFASRWMLNPDRAMTLAEVDAYYDAANAAEEAKKDAK